MARPKLVPGMAKNLRIGLVTGRLAEPVLAPLVAELNEENPFELDLLSVDNDFFGRGITVSGLMTGRDIAARVCDGNKRDLLLLPPNCINGDGMTIDDMTVAQLADVVGGPVAVGSYDLVDTLGRYCSGVDLGSEGAGRQLDELGYFVGRKK
jgi:NifB/MoaA-like Fe-S oxidoreductase